MDQPVGEDEVEALPAAVAAAVVRTDVPGTDYLPGFEHLSIPVLANAGSMGPGTEQMHDEVVVGRLTVSPQWVARTIKPTALENLRFIHGYGDSMEPTFIDGDVLLVDVGVQDPKIDGVYVLEANDRIYIKRVRQRMDGAFEISSDNPTVKTVDVLNGTNAVQVRGRVVWAWNGRKM
ncbi:helix-turn-helix transcriptional regulator [Xenophilus aerolatus]|nr:helix-turn-helix transcriptional regulator [Xenophilus aerolatus]